jgi:hypothetical protein
MIKLRINKIWMLTKGNNRLINQQQIYRTEYISLVYKLSSMTLI